MSDQSDLWMKQEQLRTSLKRQRLIICCGAGGVGKTTTATAMALAAAQLGLRVLALTIDPSKRLAQTLGVARNTPTPVQLDRERLEALGVPSGGMLSAWLLDPQLVSDRVVNAEAGEEAEALKQNLIYREISGMVAGMQEYTAVEALHGFLNDQAYDLIILDTPPSRHALRFIDSPKRVASFLDKRIFRLFVPSKTGVLGRVASKVVDEVLDRAFGEESRRELKQFFELFSRLLDHLNGNQAEMETVFRRPETCFYLITTVREDAIDEAQRFADEVSTRGLHLGGFILNRVSADSESNEHPPLSLTDALALDGLPDRGSALIEAIEGRLHRDEQVKQMRQTVMNTLSSRGALIKLGELTSDAGTLEGISGLAEQLIGPV